MSISPGSPRSGSPPVSHTLTSSWWDERRIQTTVTRDYVVSKFRSDERLRHRLDHPLAFGDGLTDLTYLDWILTRSKRIFLTLVDIGLPDQIFGVIDDSWDDDDLPVPKDTVEKLALTYEPDEAVDAKFYKRQYTYCMRKLVADQTFDFLDEEVLPVEPAQRRGIHTQNFIHNRVHVAGMGNRLFFEKKIVIEDDTRAAQIFHQEVQAVRSLVHEHVVRFLSSYIYKGTGTIILSPACDLSLKSFINSPPSLYQSKPKAERRAIAFNWLHCLADGLRYLCKHGFDRPEIKPSSLVITSSFHIIFEDVGIFKDSSYPQQLEKTKSMEGYEYGAPENWVRAQSVHETAQGRYSHSGSGGRGARTATATSTQSVLISDKSSISTGSSSGTSTEQTSTALVHRWRSTSSDHEKSAVFSLGCIFLDILSFLLKKKMSAFAAHRGQKNKVAGRGGSIPDSSFHRNLPQLDSWMANLAKEAAKKLKKPDSQIFTAYPRVISPLTKAMLSKEPQLRPSASTVQDMLFTICSEVLTDDTGNGPHCGVHRLDEDDFHGFSGWTQGSGASVNQSTNNSIRAFNSGPTSPVPGTSHSDSRDSRSTGSSAARTVSNWDDRSVGVLTEKFNEVGVAF
jgi:hypothetical protein